MIHEDVAQFLAARTLVAFPPAALEDSELAAQYLKELRLSRPAVASFDDDDLEVWEVDLLDQTLRLYRRRDQVADAPIVVYFHGGGWVTGDLDNDQTCRRLSRNGQCVVVNVGYRLAPEYPFPTPLDDCFAATVWASANALVLGADPKRLIVAGSSAGGNLAAAVTLLARREGAPTIAGQILLYPVINSDMDDPSYTENGTGYHLTKEQMAWFWAQYVPDAADRRNPLASPRHEDDLSGLPRAVVVTAEHDPLRDEAEKYAERIRSAGVQVDLRRYPGQIHGFIGLIGILKDADDALVRLEEQLRGWFG
jgi:acetyl esterase